MTDWNTMTCRIFVAIEWSELYDDCILTARNVSEESLVHLFIYEFEDDRKEIASNLDFYIYRGYSFYQNDPDIVEVTKIDEKTVDTIVTSYQEAIDYIERQ